LRTLYGLYCKSRDARFTSRPGSDATRLRASFAFLRQQREVVDKSVSQMMTLRVELHQRTAYVSFKTMGKAICTSQLVDITDRQYVCCPGRPSRIACVQDTRRNTDIPLNALIPTLSARMRKKSSRCRFLPNTLATTGIGKAACEGLS
jgi:hypothetical protein